MLNNSIDEFLKKRKVAWLKKAINASMDEIEVSEKELECEQVFALEHWLPSAAKRAGQISISTHPCTFSHPSSRKNKNGYASSIIANSKRSEDGYLRSGNVTVKADALGNAAALDVYKFLSLEMADGQTLLSHIQQDSDLAQQLLNIKSESYNTLKDGFLAMINRNSDCVTSSKIKQVYFPLDNGYHQLSILSASGIMFELRKRIDTIRFSDEAKAARACEKNNEIYDGDYKQIVNITTIGYGGTKPQNISVLNNQNGGKVHLISSEPPKLIKRDAHFPTVDFFSQSLRYFQCKDLFYSLHELFLNHKNDWNIRHERDEYYQAIIDLIIEKMWLVRSVSQVQYNPDSTRLNETQKIWLCEVNKENRETENDWLDDLCQAIARFIFTGYEKLLGKKAFIFSDDEFKHIHKQVVKNKEALR
ncbi:type I-F CRISPR-associated protein Csy1 [Coxiella burnetii]|uniref:type I-F CRISPR-associated protein Csy1 n=1 Tax=Coxiella burnetii TaxID=777 RepID=UPI0001630F17|nr:type I-F CRISPR-associated protein Csy1 [Coxiella burnetii]EAX33530.2 type I-F CRISPR-associated protein Csy1 [Coxiella burnetii 'MSU Goat Q177']UYK69883.1 type I-F CRISPR-associated protein Csy1 [Coxiella burnetii]